MFLSSKIYTINPGKAAKRKAGDAKVDNMHYLQLVLGSLLSLGYDLRLTQAVASNFGDPQGKSSSDNMVSSHSNFSQPPSVI